MRILSSVLPNAYTQLEAIINKGALITPGEAAIAQAFTNIIIAIEGFAAKNYTAAIGATATAALDIAGASQPQPTATGSENTVVQE